MEEHTNSVKELINKTGSYLETRLDLLKLQAVDKSAGVVSSLVTALIIASFVFLLVVILSIGVALWIGHETGELYYGFFIVGGFYILLSILLYAFRDKFLKGPVGNSIIQKLLK